MQPRAAYFFVHVLGVVYYGLLLCGVSLFLCLTSFFKEKSLTLQIEIMRALIAVLSVPVFC